MRRRNGTGSVKWDNITNKFRAIWFDETGKRHSKSFSEKTAAHDFLDQLNLDKKAGITVGSSKTLGQAIVELFQAEKQLSPKYRYATRKRDVQSAKLLTPLSNKSLSEITADDIMLLYRDMRQGKPPFTKAYSESQLKKTHLILRQVYRRATTGKNRLPYNPLDDIKAPSVPHKEAAYFKNSEVDALYEAIDAIASNKHNSSKHNYHIIIKMFLSSALRYGELVAIKWERINFDKRSIFICEEWNKNLRQFTELKTKNSKRHIPILSDEVFDWLIEHRQESGLVFASRNGYPIAHNCVYPLLKKAMKIAGIEKGSIHTLRHTALSRMIAKSSRLEDAQRMAGHADMSTTARFYHHILEEDTSDLLARYKTA
ncbi:MAG: site-specific integrase [Acidaminococcaceae bacterium]|nr:site-specific integrase [Acidaminococcaceae bacterium]